MIGIEFNFSTTQRARAVRLQPADAAPVVQVVPARLQHGPRLTVARLHADGARIRRRRRRQPGQVLHNQGVGRAARAGVRGVGIQNVR